MEESALFWKMIPDVTLAIKQGAGGKYDQGRITINLACNVTGIAQTWPLVHRYNTIQPPNLDLLVAHRSIYRTFAWFGRTTRRHG